MIEGSWGVLVGFGSEFELRALNSKAQGATVKSRNSIEFLKPNQDASNFFPEGPYTLLLWN